MNKREVERGIIQWSQGQATAHKYSPEYRAQAAQQLEEFLNTHDYIGMFSDGVIDPEVWGDKKIDTLNEAALLVLGDINLVIAAVGLCSNEELIMVLGKTIEQAKQALSELYEPPYRIKIGDKPVYHFPRLKKNK